MMSQSIFTKSINSMKYFFILGNHPSISVAEISATISDIQNAKLHNNNVFVFDTEEKFITEKLIRKLGGTIKIGILESSTSRYNPEKIFKLSKDLLSPTDGKYKFGISYYGNSKFNTKTIGMKIKSYLKEKDVSCRWVISKEATLSSVVVTTNKLCDRGIEIVLIEDKHNVLIGKTLAVQPFKELSFRDYDRPAKDSKSGMLPPKLAQIMINLSKISEDQTLLDPFCGSGTVLMEGLLMGIKKVIGSDISKKAVEDTKINTGWAIDKFNITNHDYSAMLWSATELSKFLGKESIDAIVSEPYLGPQRGDHEIRKVKQELEDLYSKSIKEFKKVLKKHGRVVMLWPTFVTNRDMRITNSTSSKTDLSFINPSYSGFKIINPIPAELRSDKIKTTNRNTLIYGREGQRVWREIVILEHE